MLNIIETEKLHKIYRVGDQRVHALAGVTISVPRGQFVSITGASGSGKSTLLNMLAGLETVTAGSVIVAGRHLELLNESQLVNFRRENVGFIFQSFNLISTMTAAENVALPLTFKGEDRKVREEKARELLKLVGLESHADHKPLQMSGGQQQRVGIARALIADPDIIFADEPTGNLDSRTGVEIMELLRSVVSEKGKTVVMVTHDLPLAKKTDRIIFISDGRVTSEEYN